MNERERDVLSGRCIDCGSPTGGLRCRPCNGRVEAEKALIRLEEADRTLLHEVDHHGIDGGRLATRLGISRTRAYKKIREARDRERRRQEARDAATPL